LIGPEVLIWKQAYLEGICELRVYKEKNSKEWIGLKDSWQ
jgi:hypothetical protein